MGNIRRLKHLLLFLAGLACYIPGNGQNASCVRVEGDTYSMDMPAGWNVYNSQEEDAMSDLALANVEALASGEGSGGYTRTSGKCSDPVSYKTWVSCKSGVTEECQPSDC